MSVHAVIPKIENIKASTIIFLFLLIPIFHHAFLVNLGPFLVVLFQIFLFRDFSVALILHLLDLKPQTVLGYRDDLGYNLEPTDLPDLLVFKLINHLIDMKRRIINFILILVADGQRPVMILDRKSTR